MCAKFCDIDGAKKFHQQVAPFQLTIFSKLRRPIEPACRAISERSSEPSEQPRVTLGGAEITFILSYYLKISKYNAAGNIADSQTDFKKVKSNWSCRYSENSILTIKSSWFRALRINCRIEVGSFRILSQGSWHIISCFFLKLLVNRMCLLLQTPYL